MKIINFEKKKIIPLTSKKTMNQILIKQTVTFAKRLEINALLIKIAVKLGTTATLQLNIEMLHILFCNLKYSITKDTPMVFHKRTSK